MPDDRLPQRTLVTTFWLAAAFTLVFAVYGHTTIAFGLAIGAAIGLSSLASLIYVVPRLLQPDKPAARFLMGMVAFSKLPIYAVALNFAMTSRYIQPVAVFIGAALVPLVIVLKVLGHQLTQKAGVSAGGTSCRS